MLDASTKCRHAALSCPSPPASRRHEHIVLTAQAQAQHCMDIMRVSDPSWREALAQLLS
jgi:hypothetical protein